MNTVQTIQLKILEQIHFNQFNGAQVAKDLRKHQHLWSAAIIHGDPLIVLRDLASGIYNADTLLLTEKPGCHAELQKLAGTWKASEVTWIAGPSSKIQDVLRVWWD